MSQHKNQHEQTTAGAVQPYSAPTIGETEAGAEQPHAAGAARPQATGAEQPHAAGAARPQATGAEQPHADPLFISFEGGEGVGKSTQIRILAARLSQAGYEVCCLREPGGTSIGEQIRHILLSTDNTSMTPLAELLLYEAARAQIVEEVIRPALAAGKVVLVDRFFDSTTAYQSFARGLNRELVDRANAIGSDNLTPTRTILLNQDVDCGLQKATEDGADRLESESRDFHERVHYGFEQLAKENPWRFARVRCQEQKEDTHELVFAAVKDLFSAKAAEPFVITEELLHRIKDQK